MASMIGENEVQPSGEDLTRRIRFLMEETMGAGGFSVGRCLVLRHGVEAVDVTIGCLASHGEDGLPLPADRREPATPSTLFDLASLTKTFSAYALLRLVVEGRLDLDAPLGDVLPEWRGGDRGRATLRHLLTHTAGLPPSWYGWRGPLAEAMKSPDRPSYRRAPLPGMREELEEDLLHTSLVAAPGTVRCYSDVSFNTAMVLAERVTGRSWPDLMESLVLAPLGLGDVTYHPDPARTAATEFVPEMGRGMVRGAVHDETSWALGSTCANAGLFGTAAMVAGFAETIRLGEEEPASRMLWNDALESVLGGPVDVMRYRLHGASLGLQIGATGWMGEDGSAFRGHTGFTGTSFQTDRVTGLTIVLLTNRVHPTRRVNMLGSLRRGVAEAAIGWARDFRGFRSSAWGRKGMGR